MGIELRKELLNGKFADSKHEGLIAIIPGAKIAGTKSFGHRNLRDFLATHLQRPSVELTIPPPMPALQLRAAS